MIKKETRMDKTQGAALQPAVPTADNDLSLSSKSAGKADYLSPCFQ